MSKSKIQEVRSIGNLQQQPTLEQRVMLFIQEHQLISPGEKLVVAVSGGPDSVCLVHLLVKLHEGLGIGLHVAHLNHQLRGVEAKADAKYVADLARRLAIPATIESRDVKAYRAQHRLSLEEAAREVRYAFLAQAARDIGAQKVAVGHTRDDHIETILMHLIRGTGTRGLQGLQPRVTWPTKSNSLTIIRPLLEVSREETASYCQEHQLMPRLDASNLSLSPLRNRIRQQLLPLLRSYNPRVAEALLRTARIAGDDLDYLNKQIIRFWDEIAQIQEDTIALNKSRLLELPPALRRYFLRSAIEKLLGNIKDIEAHHIESMMSALTKPAGKKLNLPHGLIFAIEYDKFVIAPAAAALSPLPALSSESPLTIPGETLLPGWRVEANIISPAAKADAGEYKAYFDFDKTGDKLLVRSRQRGDRFQPLGMSQPKKLNEFMIDAKIPRPWRQRIPIVCSSEHIIWVVGWRINERVKVTEDTKKVLRLEFKRG